MGGAVIAQQVAGSEGSTNKKVALVAPKDTLVIDSTEGGRTEQRVAATLETILPDQHEEDNERLPGDGAGDRGRHHLFEQPGRAEQDGKGSAGSKDTACVALFSDNRPTHFCGSRGRVNQMRRSQGTGWPGRPSPIRAIGLATARRYGREAHPTHPTRRVARR